MFDKPAFIIDVLCAVSQIHTYLSTHGVTLRGKDQAHADDWGSDGRPAGPRKCPRILNDWTQAETREAEQDFCTKEGNPPRHPLRRTLSEKRRKVR